MPYAVFCIRIGLSITKYLCQPTFVLKCAFIEFSTNYLLNNKILLLPFSFFSATFVTCSTSCFCLHDPASTAVCQYFWAGIGHLIWENVCIVHVLGVRLLNCANN